MTELARGPIPLNKMKVYDGFIPGKYNTNNYTLAAYIFPIAGDKTLKRTSHINQNPPVMGWDGVFLFTQESNGTTYLSINTISNGQYQYDKYIKVMCPPLPSQKWTHVAVVIEGRRFSVLYNGKIVSSKIIGEMPRITKTGVFFTGNGINKDQGAVAYVSWNKRAMSSEEILIEYASTSNTRGEPYLSGSILDLFGCPAGLFCMQGLLPTPKPGSMAWSTPFA